MNLERIKKHRSVVESFLSLSVINGVNMLLPFISLPYMLRVIGPSNYGVYTYVYTLLQYLVLIVSYGFMFTATKQVAQNRDDKAALNKIYNSVFFSKLVLLFGSLIIFVIISPIFLDTPSKQKQFYWGLGIVLGELLMPTYFFQGMEKMRYLTILNIIPKVIFTILIFIVVKSSKDYEYIILLNSAGFIVAGITSMATASRIFQVKISKPELNVISSRLREGLSVFASTIGINIYRNTNIIILGLVCSDSVVGVYGAAEKIIKAAQSLITPLTQAIFPHSASKMKTMTIGDGAKHVLNLTREIALPILGVSLIIFLIAPQITITILGKEFTETIPLIRIMTIVIFCGGLNYVLGIIGLVIIGKGTKFFQMVVIGGIVCLIITLLFSKKYTYNAAAWGMSLAEIVVALFAFIYLKYLSKNN